MSLLQNPLSLVLFAILFAALVGALWVIARKEKQLNILRESVQPSKEASGKEGFIKEAAHISAEVLDAAPVMYLLTVGSVVIDSNKYAREIVGISPGDNVREFYFDPSHMDKMSERLANSEYIISENVQFIIKTNEITRFLVNMARIESESGPGVVLWGINIEKSERRKDAIERAQKDMQMLINTLPLPLIIFDPVNLTTMYGNAACASLLGKDSPHGIIGREVVSLLFDESVKSSEKTRIDSLRELVDRVINSGVPVERELRHISPEGEVITTKAICTNFVYMGVYSILVIIQDISAEIKKAEMLSSMAEKEREANELKSKFIVNMSHEIRTPLNAILGLSEIEMANTRDTEKNNVFKKIYLSAKNLLLIVTDILDFSKIETERLYADAFPFELEEVLADALSVAATRAREKELQIYTQISGNLPHKLTGDKKMLWQALKNPLDNSAKYTDNGHITLSVRPAGEAVSGYVNIIFVIEDTGIGMEEEHLSRIFIPFEQFGDSAKKHVGTGLGMSITKGITEALGGTIDVESTVGKGTKITIVLPFALAEPMMSIAEKNTQPFLESRKVLVVDSRKAVRDSIMELLTSVKMTAYCVSSGEEAVRAINALESSGGFFDAALVNYGAKETGEAVSAVIKEVSRSTPKIIAMTHLTGDSGASPLIGDSFDSYIEMPSTPSSLIRKIRETLEFELQNVDTPYEAEDVVFENAKVLLCEDNAINQDVAVGLLQIYGIEPVIAENGAEALALLEDSSFDLIFMDILMPVMTGHEATVKIRSSDKSYKDTPIVAMTANALGEEIDKCRDEGMNGYIMKPIDAESLYRELLKWLPHRLAAPPVKTEQPSAAPPPPEDTGRLNIPGIDAEDGLKRFANKSDRYEKSLVKFVDELKESIPAAKDAARDGNLSAGQFVAHKIKGIAGNLGAKDLFERGKLLETAFAEGKNDTALLKDFVTSAEMIMNGITDVLLSAIPPEEESVAMIAGTAAEAAEILSELKEGVLRFDPEMTEKAVSRLKQKKWEKIDEVVLNEIYILVENYQFETAEEQINLLLEGLS